MKKLTALLLSSTVILSLMTGCGSKPVPTPAPSQAPSQAADPQPSAETSDSKVVIGLLVYNDKNEFIQKVVSGAQAKCDEYGYELIEYSADGDAATEVSNMEDLITKKPNVILYNPVDSDAAEAALSLANDANIPVITVDRTANGGEVVSHVASDNVYGGKIAGEYILAQLGEAGGQLVEIQGVAGTSAARDRGEGFHSAVDGVANVEVVISQIGNWDKAQGMTIMENALQAHPEIKGVFAHNDTMAMGALEAATAAGREDIVIVGFDADDDAVQSVKDGKLANTVAQQPQLMGSRGVELAYNYLNNLPLEKEEAVEVALVK